MTPNASVDVPGDAIHAEDDTPDAGLHVGVASDAASHGSALGFGVKWIKPALARTSGMPGPTT